MRFLAVFLIVAPLAGCATTPEPDYDAIAAKMTQDCEKAVGRGTPNFNTCMALQLQIFGAEVQQKRARNDMWRGALASGLIGAGQGAQQSTRQQPPSYFCTSQMFDYGYGVPRSTNTHCSPR